MSLWENPISLGWKAYDLEHLAAIGPAIDTPAVGSWSPTRTLPWPMLPTAARLQSHAGRVVVISGKAKFSLWGMRPRGNVPLVVFACLGVFAESACVFVVCFF